MNRLTEHFLSAPGGIFTITDVHNAFDGSDFSRHALIKRALADGEILGIRRGLYCLAPRYNRSPVNPYALSQRIYGPSYVSLESALSFHGWIPEAVYTCTCVSFNRSKRFETPLGQFSFERVLQKALFCQVERVAEPGSVVYFMATPAKALADMVYTRKAPWGTIDDAAGDLRIEHDDTRGVTIDELDVLMDNYDNRRVRRFLATWKGALKP
ncbi:MAG TPA: hypothetical protein PLZ31_10530 [Myxococcota bacterium]|nr:hypothetical protein [Myxococcota bacterium]